MTLRRQFVTFGAAAVTFSLAACTDASAPTAPAVSANVVALAVVPTALAPDVSGNATISAPGHYVNTTNAVFKTVSIASSGVTLDGLTFDGGGSTGAAVAAGSAAAALRGNGRVSNVAAAAR